MLNAFFQVIRGRHRLVLNRRSATQRSVAIAISVLTWLYADGAEPCGRRPGRWPIPYQAPGSRPRSHAARVVEIAAVAEHGSVRRLLLLNQDLCQLASIPVLGFSEDAMVDVARAAGIEYRRYHIDAALSGGPAEIDGYFPRASQFASIAGPHQAVPVARWVNS